MMKAFVLVSTNVGKENKVLEKVRNVDGVEEAHALWGVYDLMVTLKANSFDRLKEIIKSGISQLTGVSNVLTLLIVDSSKVPIGE